MQRLARCCAVFGLLLMPAAAVGEDIPDALAVQWQGKPPCEKLYEDAEIRVARCVFPPGAVHMKHKHPAYLTYVLSGGKGEAKDASGGGSRETRDDQLLVSPEVPWHEFSNVGDTTIRYLVIEKKYALPAK